MEDLIEGVVTDGFIIGDLMNIEDYMPKAKRKTTTNIRIMSDKIKFLGQYLEQKVAKETKYPNSPTINTTVVLYCEWVEFYHLELKDPSKISEEDLVLFSKNLNVVATDFLRSMGYAQQFMQYSIEDLVKLGWVKLI